MMTTDLAADFERNGFIPRVRVLDAAGVDRTRREFDALEAVEGREKCQIGLQDRHFDQRFVWDIATHPAVLDAVEAALGPDILILATHFFCKYPSGRVERGEGRGESDGADPSRPSPLSSSPERFVAWHQDVTYWGLEPPLAVTAWYAVDDSDAENGCMRVIPGTHRGIREHGTAEKPGNLLSINQEVPVTAEEEERAVDLALRAGEISLHHGVLIHGSNPNRSGRRRCGLTIRYIPPYVKQVAMNSLKRPWSPVVVRGSDPYRHFGERSSPFPQAL